MKCSECNGTGKVANYHECPVCEGSGERKNEYNKYGGDGVNSD